MFSSIPCLKRASISWKSCSSSPVGRSSATVMRLPLPGVSSSVIIEPGDLFYERLRLLQVAGVLPPRSGEIELLDAAGALPFLDQRLAQRLVGFRIVRIVGDARLELVDPRRRGGLLDPREHQRPRL